MAINSLKEQVKTFNQELHLFESECADNIRLTLDIVESIDPKRLKQHTDQLRDYLAGMMMSENQEEFSLYQQSFTNKLNNLTMNTDVLGVYETIFTLQQISELAQATLRLNVNNEEREFILNTRLRLLDDCVNKFLQHANELAIAIRERIVFAKDQAASSATIDGLEKALIKIDLLKLSFQKAKDSAEDMLKATEQSDFEEKRENLETILHQIQNISSMQQANDELKNFFINMLNKQAQALATVRTTYLPGPTHLAEKTIDFGWMIAGFALLTVGLIFSAPITVLGLSIAGIAYGAIDLSKEIVKPIKERQPAIGEREKTLTPKELIPASAGMAETTVKMLEPKRVAKEIFPIVVSGLALAAGVIAFAVPPLAIPMAIVGLGLALMGGISYARKLYRERQAKKASVSKHTALENKHAKEIASEHPEEIIQKKLSKSIQQKSHALHSEAKIDLFLLGHSLNQRVSEKEIQQLKKDVRKNKEKTPFEESLFIEKEPKRKAEQTQSEKNDLKETTQTDTDSDGTEHLGPKK